MKTTDNRKLEYFPQSYIDLNMEIQYHPELCNILNTHPSNEFEIRLAEIAVYCEVILDGDYDGRDLVKLAGHLYKKLVEKRSGIVIVGGNVQ